MCSSVDSVNCESPETDSEACQAQGIEIDTRASGIDYLPHKATVAL